MNSSYWSNIIFDNHQPLIETITCSFEANYCNVRSLCMIRNTSHSTSNVVKFYHFCLKLLYYFCCKYISSLKFEQTAYVLLQNISKNTHVVFLSNVQKIWIVGNLYVSVQKQNTGTIPDVPQVRYSLLFVHVYIAFCNWPDFYVPVHYK